MTHLVLRKILTRTMQMLSVTVVSIMIRKLLLFILEQETITQVQVGLRRGIVLREEGLIH